MSVPDGYDEFTVADVRKFVRDADAATLDALYEHEADTKARSTALEAIDEARTRDETVDTTTVDAEDGDDEDDESEAEDGDDEDAGDPVDDVDHTQRIVVRCPRGGHVAGYSFTPGEVKHVPANGPVQRALRKGQLQFLANSR